MENAERERDSYEVGREVASGWGWLAMTGIGLIVLGAIAVGASFVTGVVTMAYLGALLAVGGIGEIIAAFRFRKHAFGPLFLGGLLSTIVGCLLLWQPIAGLAAAGALVGAFFVTAGLFRAITSIVDRYEQWGWDFAYGVISALLGIYVLAGWPMSSLGVVGAIVGAELMMRGSAWLAASVVARRIHRATREAHA